MQIAELLQNCSGERVGGIAKGTLVLDDDAPVEQGTIDRIGSLCGIRMNRVGVVGGDHEAPADQAVLVLGGEAKRKTDALNHIPQKAGVRTLTAAASDLFVVENTVDGNAALRLRIQKAQERAVAALQIVQPGGGEKFFLRTPKARCFPDTEIQIRCENALRDGVQPGGQLCPEGAGITGFTENRKQICLRVQRLFLVLVPGQVRGERRDDQKILFRPDQTVAQMISFIEQHAHEVSNLDV